MAMCSVEGCGGKHCGRGLCEKHYWRWRRNGDPLAGRTPNGEALRFLENHRHYADAQCLLWPYGKYGNGYGKVWQDGRTRPVHAVMLELVAGPPPTPEHEAAHSCGVRACINPRHLRWATRSENQMDKLLHGTHNRGERHWGAKVTEAQVREILELLEQGVRQREAGRLYGISQSSISLIKRGKNWAWLEDRGA